jgi:SNF2 family DNA or RNA helicase
MSASGNINEYLNISNIIAKNELNSDSPLSTQPLHIKTPLKLHQLTVLESMKYNEKNYPSGLNIHSNETCYSTFGILGDRVGVGKTLMILGHISQMALEPLHTEYSSISLRDKSSPPFFSIVQNTCYNDIFDSLVVVPHGLYSQWVNTINNETTLSFLCLKSHKDLDKPDLIKRIKEAHITLISNTLLPSLMTTIHATVNQPIWRRIIYDEADSIKIVSSCKVPIARITWFVTASYNNLFFVNKYFHIYHFNQIAESTLVKLDPSVQTRIQTIKESNQTILFYKTVSYPFFKQFLDVYHPLRAHTLIKNSDTFIDASVQIPPCYRHLIQCSAPFQQQLIENILPKETLNMLHAGDVQGALQSLGVPSRTNITLVDAVTSFKQRELSRLKRRLAFKEGEEYDNNEIREEVLQTLTKKIELCSQTIDSLSKRVTELSKDSCAICLETPTNNCIPPCCAKPFCGECILRWMSSNSSCPNCRAELHISQLVHLEVKDTMNELRDIKNKRESLLELLEDNPDGQFLIFSRYDNTFNSLKTDIEETLSYSTSTLQGNKDIIYKSIKDFDDKLIRVLFMNSKTSAAGMNLQSASHVILLHRMNDEEEKQIIGRAYRLGRTTPLNVYQLLHQRE